MDFRQRLEQSRTKPANIEPIADADDHFICPYFAADRGTNPVCLDLRLKGGVRKAIPYIFITEIDYDIDKGIELFTSGKHVTIIGRNLTKLYDYLIVYKVRYIQANIGSDANEDGLFVKEILLEMD